MSLPIHARDPRLLLGGSAGSWREGGMLRSQHCSDRALLGSSLKQHHYFRDMYKGKFPVSTVCEGAGPNEGGICHLWKLGDAVDTPPAH